MSLEVPREDRIPSLTRGLLFEQAMKQTRMAVCLTDPHAHDNPIVFANEAFLALTGYPREEVLGRNCRFLQGDDTDDATRAAMRRAIEDETVIVVELLNYRKDGSSFWNALHLGPIYDEDGKLLYFFGSQWNVSDIRTARANEEQAKMLARELSHRMKNMFSVIGAIVRITGRVEQASGVTDRISERISALGRAYETTLDDVSAGTVEIGGTIHALVAPYDPEGSGRIVMKGPSMRIASNSIATIGLCLHELASNALRHGALISEDGRVEIEWSAEMQDGNRTLSIVWTETGGPEVREPSDNAGMGSRIFSALMDYIGGDIETQWLPSGVCVTLRIPRV